MTLDLRGDWVGLIEAIHSEARDDAAWAAQVMDMARPLFPRAVRFMAYSLAYDAERKFASFELAAPRSFDTIYEALDKFKDDGRSGYMIPFHFSGPVLTMQEGLSKLNRDAASEIARARDQVGYGDAIGIVAHPRPGLVTVLSPLFDDIIELSRTERELLRRVAMHLESGSRLRSSEDAVIAEIGPRGRILEPKLEAHVAQIREARSRAMRCSPEGAELWTALLEGRMSVVPRGSGYLVLDNPTSSYRMRALTPRETAILSLSVRGSSTKDICYALGISPARVSSSLQSAATKLGVLSRTDLVRLAALLVRDPRGLLEDEALTEAENGILELLERGLGNREIAAIRMRSVRTIANQVAGLLRKTGSSSRRELVARAATRGRLGS